MSENDDDNLDLLSPEDLEDDDIVEDIPEPDEEPAECFFDGGKGYVGKSDADRISQQGFYGTRLDDGRLELESVELLHLIERKRVTVRTTTGENVNSKQIINALQPEDSDLWVRYLVFRDLRSRGYAVRQGFGGGIDFRVYARGDRPGTAVANQLIYILKEGEPISLHDLDMVTESASAARKRLVFALVDQNGEVNYYRVAQATLQNRVGDSK
ncbi:MAG: tRNA-intron lyase [Candidatus Thorarchaeota archaeon]